MQKQEKQAIMDEVVTVEVSESELKANDNSPNKLEIKLYGNIITELPQDLYIPPEALRIFLDTFQGPLDLLLYLIKKQNIDILDIPIVEITKQYMRYVEIMQEFNLELAAEYLVMAAMLAEIKSRMLLPRPESTEENEQDPRAELVRRLQEYERFQKAALELDAIPRMERDYFPSVALAPSFDFKVDDVDVDMNDLLKAIADVLRRAKLYSSHQIELEPLSIRERMTAILSTVTTDVFTPFTKLFTVKEGRMGVVVTLIAILELIRQSVLELVQDRPFAPIYVKAKG